MARKAKHATIADLRREYLRADQALTRATQRSRRWRGSVAAELLSAADKRARAAYRAWKSAELNA